MVNWDRQEAVLSSLAGCSCSCGGWLSDRQHTHSVERCEPCYDEYDEPVYELGSREPVWPIRPRTKAWIRRAAKRPTPIATWITPGEEKATMHVSELGFDMYEGPVLYDNGDFYVIDQIIDHEWAVYGPWPNKRFVVVHDFDKAVWEADDYQRIYRDAVRDGVLTAVET